MLSKVINLRTGCYGNTAHRQESLPGASGAWLPSSVWRDEQSLSGKRRRETGWGRLSQTDREEVRAELCSPRVRAGNGRICC